MKKIKNFRGVEIIFPAELDFKDVVEVFDEIVNNYYAEENIRSFEVMGSEDRDFFRITLKDGTVEDSDYIGGRLIYMGEKVMKEEFMKKYNLTEKDYKNLLRYEDTRQSGVMNMFEYLYLMKKHGVNGGAKLADLILKSGFYSEFLKTIEGV